MINNKKGLILLNWNNAMRELLLFNYMINTNSIEEDYSRELLESITVVQEEIDIIKNYLQPNKGEKQ